MDPRALARLRWRSRRGMRELDVVLDRYLDGAGAAMTPAEVETFEALLETQDPILYTWVMGSARPESAALAALVDVLRGDDR